MIDDYTAELLYYSYYLFVYDFGNVTFGSLGSSCCICTMAAPLSSTEYVLILISRIAC